MQRNQRQKKKSSQAKKRYYDTAKAKDSKSHQEKPPSEQQKTVETQNKEPAQTAKEKDGVVTVKDHKKYSKRKVTSNWDRYEQQDDAEGSSPRTWDSEEQLQQRLVQLLNLPVHHSPLSTMEHTTTGETYSNVGTPFLTLDCESLALTISSLPLHERLDISQELLELSQTGHGSTDHSGSEVSQNIGVSPDKDDDMKVEKFDLKVLMSGQKKSSHARFTFQAPSIGVTVDSTQKEPSKCPQSQEEVRDKELDSLLEQSTSTSVTAPQQEETREEKDQRTIVSDSVSQLPGETDELDEMLDELLA